MGWYKKKQLWICICILIPLAVLIYAPFYLGNHYCVIDQTAEDAASSENTAPNQEQGTADPSPVVKLLKAIDDHQRATSQAQKSEQEPKSFGRRFWCEINLADFLIALFTYALVVVTGGLIYTGIRQETWARHMWKAARYANTLSRDAFISVHRPKIRLKHLWLESEIWTAERITFSIVIVNHGETDAEIIELGYGILSIKNSSRLPPKPVFQAIINRSNAVLPSGITHSFEQLPATKALTTDEWIDTRSNRAKIYCFGYVDYRDMSKRIRKTTFCRVLDITAGRDIPGRFIPMDPIDTDYEYQD